jgi:hypothetical protein
MPRAVAVPVRQTILRRSQQGQSASAIAEELGLPARTVRHLIGRLSQGPEALAPSYRTRPAPPHPLLHDALDYRTAHPSWGAQLIRLHLLRDQAQLRSPADFEVPTARTLQRWFAAAGLGPAQPGRKGQPRRARASQPHQVWQMDAADQVLLGSGRKVSWLRLVDECSGAFLLTEVFDQPFWVQAPVGQVRQALRGALGRWGLPGLLRVDNGQPWGSKGEQPTDLALWLIGLGVDLWWNAPRRPWENGVVERSQGTAKRWAGPGGCLSAGELQGRFDELDELQRCSYPYQGGQSRLGRYPALVHSGLGYEEGREGQSWDWSRVAEHLAGYCVPREVDSKGQVSIYNRNHYVGRRHRGKQVHVMFDACSCEWVIADEAGRIFKQAPADELSRERIQALQVTHRRDS